MFMKFKIITNDDEWEETIKKVPQATVYHTSNWKKLVENHGCKGYLIVAKNGENISGIFPVYTTKSKLLRLKQFSSIPFSDQESIIINDEPDKTVKTLFDGLFYLVNEFESKRTILTTNLILRQDAKILPMCRYLFNTNGLTEEKFWESLDRSVHSSIRKGKDKNVKCVMKDDLGIYDECVSMFNDMTKRRNYKFTKYTRQFFVDLGKFMKDYIKVFILEIEEKPMAIIIAFNFNGNLYGWTFLTYSNVLSYNPGDLLMWEMIKWVIKNGFNSIDFGTLPLGNEINAHRFKNKFKTHIEKTYLLHINHSSKSNFEDSMNSILKILIKVYFLLKNINI